MRRRLAAKLNDIFAKIGLDRIDPRRLERGVEAKLLGDHRLAFGHGLGAALLTELQDDIDAFPGGQRIMDMAAGGDNLRLIGFEIEIEMGERVILDVARAVAQRLEFRQARGGGGALFNEIAAHETQRILQRRVLQRRMGVFLEMGRIRHFTHGRAP
jgi:hypothetical protein